MKKSFTKATQISVISALAIVASILIYSISTRPEGSADHVQQSGAAITAGPLVQPTGPAIFDTSKAALLLAQYYSPDSKVVPGVILRRPMKNSEFASLGLANIESDTSRDDIPLELVLLRGDFYAKNFFPKPDQVSLDRTKYIAFVFDLNTKSVMFTKAFPSDQDAKTLLTIVPEATLAAPQDSQLGIFDPQKSAQVIASYYTIDDGTSTKILLNQSLNKSQLTKLGFGNFIDDSINFQVFLVSGQFSGKPFLSNESDVTKYILLIFGDHSSTALVTQGYGSSKGLEDILAIVPLPTATP